MVTADGIGMSMPLNIRYTFKERVTGYDLTAALMERLKQDGGSVFLRC